MPTTETTLRKNFQRKKCQNEKDRICENTAKERDNYNKKMRDTFVKKISMNKFIKMACCATF